MSLRSWRSVLFLAWSATVMMSTAATAEPRMIAGRPIPLTSHHTELYEKGD